MRARALELAAELGAEPAAARRRGGGRGAAFLAWLEDHNFTFLGYREYELAGDERRAAARRRCPARASGSCARPAAHESSRGFDKLPPAVRARALEPYLLNLTKANSRATVHRAAYLDYVGVKRFDAEGRVVGERRFLGLYTHTRLPRQPARDPDPAPQGRRRCSRARRFPHGSHNEKALHRDPRDLPARRAVPDLGRRAVRDRDRDPAPGRAPAAAAVRAPRHLRPLPLLPGVRAARPLQHREPAPHRGDPRGAPPARTSIDYTTRVSESVLVRLHYLVYAEPGRLPDVRRARDRDAAGGRHALVGRRPRGGAASRSTARSAAARCCRRYGDAFPAAYRADWVPRSALADIAPASRRWRRRRPGAHASTARSRRRRARCARRSSAPARRWRCRTCCRCSRTWAWRWPTSAPTRSRPRDARAGLDLRLRPHLRRRATSSRPTACARPSRTRSSAPGAATSRTTATTGSSCARGLTWREIDRAARDRRATCARPAPRSATATWSRRWSRTRRWRGCSSSCSAPASTPGAPDAAAAERLVAADRGGDRRGREPRPGPHPAQLPRTWCRRCCARTTSSATPDGGPKLYLSFKLDPAQLPWLPLPRPRFEIFVYSPRTEGVHLRGGKVARGGHPLVGPARGLPHRGARADEGADGQERRDRAGRAPRAASWSSGRRRRRPRGAARRGRGLLPHLHPRAARPDRQHRRRRDRAAARRGALRRATTPTSWWPPTRARPRFSDVANEIVGASTASGSATRSPRAARPATTTRRWASPRAAPGSRSSATSASSATTCRARTSPWSASATCRATCSATGCCCREHIRLVGAFDHRARLHRPRPRRRPRAARSAGGCSSCPRSSWDDYDRELISPGGGVFPRTRQVDPAVARGARGARRRGRGAGAERADPGAAARAGRPALERRHRHLRQGERPRRTPTRATRPTTPCASTPPSCAAAVVGEGGNLGLTQRARIEYALGGGRINTDAIDNSGGVDCSDREVNIKILLDAVVADGDLTGKQRNELLAEMTDAVAELVLKDNYEQTETLSLAEAQAAEHARRARALHRAARAARAGSTASSSRCPATRSSPSASASSGGLTRPELAVLLAYSKIDLYAELLDSDVPEDPYLSGRARPLLPGAAARALRRARCASTGCGARSSPRRWSTTCCTAAARRSRSGCTRRPARPRRRSRAPTPSARDIFEMRPQWAEIEALDNRVAAEVADRDAARGPPADRARLALAAAQPRRGRSTSAPTVEYFAPGAAGPVRRAPAPARARRPRAAARARRGARGRPACRPAWPCAWRALAHDVRDLRHRRGGRARPASTWSRWRRCTSGSASRLAAALAARPHRRAAARRPLARAGPRGAARRPLRPAPRAHRRGAARRARPTARPTRGWTPGSRPTRASERCLATLADIRVGQVFDLTTLPVAVREVRNLLQAS